MFRRTRIHAGWVLVGILLLSIWSCEDEAPLQPFAPELDVVIIAGPGDGLTVLNNAPFTFEWRVVGGEGDVVFEYQLQGVDPQPVTTGDFSKTYSGLPSGQYTFSVTARAGNETDTDTRNFTVAANAGPPQVVITGPRGSASSGGSGVVPSYAPEALVKLQWQASDPDVFGQVVAFRWKPTDAADFGSWAPGTVASFNAPSAPGDYTFVLEAQDNAGAVATVSFPYRVKAPTILIVDDKTHGDVLDEIAEDRFFETLFEGFAFAMWDVETQGLPAGSDLTPFEVVVVSSGSNSDLWDLVGDQYPESPVMLSEFLDAGGRLLAMGQGIMEDVAFPSGPGNDHSNPPDATEFEAVYLHLAPATGDSATDAAREWARAGEFSGDGKFSSAVTTLGDAARYPKITIDVESGDVDRIVPGDGAEIIYSGLDGLGNAVGDVGLRFPAGGADTKVVFLTFPLFESRNNQASTVNARTLVQTLMAEMQQD